eukprot:CAMPEP_0185259110 /NCGR_PEP_ID=MMETSP1359-20130426/7948_1 /TAXON_ID=552665 /ORGANISM="Bigelowiella longifila, Strain CCMP242" /LENGTH=132 /DNA_ID=CAMNT_0027844895 /DNA_START=203 /DNA_END=604 /DNA_ORIENTATION=+
MREKALLRSSIQYRGGGSSRSATTPPPITRTTAATPHAHDGAVPPLDPPATTAALNNDEDEDEYSTLIVLLDGQVFLNLRMPSRYMQLQFERLQQAWTAMWATPLKEMCSTIFAPKYRTQCGRDAVTARGWL